MVVQTKGLDRIEHVGVGGAILTKEHAVGASQELQTSAGGLVILSSREDGLLDIKFSQQIVESQKGVQYHRGDHI